MQHSKVRDYITIKLHVRRNYQWKGMQYLFTKRLQTQNIKRGASGITKY